MKKKIISLLLAIFMIAGMLPLSAITAFAEEDGIGQPSVPFRFYDEEAKVMRNTKLTDSYTSVTSGTTSWTTGWYVASGTVEINSRVSVTGDVKLILADGCKLTVNGGINVMGTNKFSVFGQPKETGELIASGSEYAAGIGGDDKQNCGTVNIYGGVVTANGGSDGAGIGGGHQQNCGTVNIYGGVVTANGYGGAGIGGGSFGSGGSVTIHGGIITANGTNAAGIGGGWDGSGGTVNIYGGEVTASGSSGSAGIGGGWDGSGGTVRIHGGKVTASGAPGIGGGSYGGDGTVEINGGNVTATSESDGIRGAVTINGGNVTASAGGSGICGNVTINGGNVTATGGDNGAGIGGTVTINGGNVTATGGGYSAGIGGGYAGNGGTVTINGGKVTANGGQSAPGIGSGYLGSGGTLIINGGSITARGGWLCDTGISFGGGSGSIVVGNNIRLVNAVDGTLYTKGNGQAWIDVLGNGNVSLCALSSSIPYLEYDAETNSFEEQKCSQYEIITPNTVTLADGRYVICGTMTVEHGIEVTGDAYLILTDNCDLTVNGGIKVEGNNSIAVYSQSNGECAGKLTANGTKNYAAGIGGGDGGNGGTVTINGGNVFVNGHSNAAGIGGGYGGNGGTVTINGGNITAAGGSNGAGIGGGYGGNGGTVTINGGNVSVACEYYRVGIGSGRDGNGGTVTINGGNVSAVGGKYSGASINAAVTINEKLCVYNKDTGKPIMKKDGQTWKDAIVGIPIIIKPESESSVKDYVEYVDGNFDSKTYEGDIYYPLPNPYASSSSVVWDNEWYTVDSEYGYINTRITVIGDVKLILKDGCMLTATKGIFVGKDSTLTIYGQSNGTGKLRAAVGHNATYCAAIGGGEKGSSTNNCDCGVVNIHGGTFDVKGGNSAAGIGGGKGGSGGTVNIYGGDIEAEGGTYSAGIGGGEGDTGGTVNIFGGNVTANCGTSGAGIGSGSEGAAVTVNISGGTVTAVGTYGSGGAGIGSGDGVAGTITISGGKVTATGDFGAAGIGCGSFGSFGDIIISGGDVTATATERAAGIGGNMMFDGGSVSIYKDATVRAIAAEGMPGIIAGTVTVYPGSAHEVIHVKQNDADIQGSPFTHTTVIGGLLGDGNVDVLPENSAHSFTGSYVDNGDGTHSRKCTGCEELGTPEAHTWQSVDAETHKCTVCETVGNHTDGDKDGKCDLCGYVICTHANTEIVYEWNDDYTVCTATKKCDDCQSTLLAENATEIKLVEDTHGANCQTPGKGHYEATFATLGTAKTAENGVDTTNGEHHYINYVCEYCGDELLEDAKADAIKAIHNAADNSEDTIVLLLAETAETTIDNAEKVAEVIAIRNRYVAAIEKLTGSTHEHTYSENWSHNATHHWHDSTCEHTGLTSGFAAHIFGEGVVDGNKTVYTCTECGYQKFVYNPAEDTEGEVIGGTTYTGISLTLGSDISINFYMELSEEARQNGTMTFDIGGRVVSGVKAKYNETENKYYFQTPLTALEMNETVIATFNFNGIDYIQEYSVADYIAEIVGHPETYGEKAIALAKKIANYGHYAQTYLESIHKNVTIGEGGYTEMYKCDDVDINVADAKTALENYKVTVTGTLDNLSLYGSTVYFDSATALNYYVTVKDGKKPTATAVNKVTDKEKDVEIKLYKDNIYIVSVKDITATELADDIEVVINNEITLTGSVFAYCNSVVKAHSFDGATEKDTFAVNAMAAFYEYYEAAMEYISFELHFDMPEHYKVFTADGEEITGDTTVKCYRTFSFRLVPDENYKISRVISGWDIEPDENGLYTVSYVGGKHDVAVYTKIDSYCLTVTVEGEDGGEMPDTKISFVCDGDETIYAQCFTSGIYEIEIPKGKSGTIVVEKSGYQKYSQEFTADGKVEEITVNLIPND